MNSTDSPVVASAAMRSETVSPLASFICDAMVRFQISSYSLASSPDRPICSRRAERLAGRTDGLVRLLGVLDLAGVGARGVREVLRAVQLAHLGARRVERGLRQRRRSRCAYR